LKVYCACIGLNSPPKSSLAHFYQDIYGERNNSILRRLE